MMRVRFDSVFVRLVSALVVSGTLAAMDASAEMGKYQLIVTRNPFSPVAVKTTEEKDDKQVWANDLVIVGLVSSAENKSLTVVIEEKSSKLVYFCSPGDKVKDDIILDRVEQTGDSLRAFLRNGKKSATLDFEAKTASSTAAGAAPPPPMAPGGSPPIPPRRIPVPIRR
jgi:hypothetical protein